MSEQNKLKVKCKSCKVQFTMALPEGKDFGELNYRLYGRRPLVCPKCGLEEQSDYDHHGSRYFFANFDNLGRIAGGEQAPDISKNCDGKDSNTSKEE